MNCRYIKRLDNIYLRADDVVKILLEFAVTEETDTKERVLKMARELSKDP